MMVCIGGSNRLSKMKRVQMLLEEDLLKRLDAEAELKGMNRSEFMRLALEEKLSAHASVEGIDSTVKALRRVLSDELNPQFNRMAKMVAKSTKAAATGMYLQVVELNAAGSVDAVKAFRDAKIQATAYLTSRNE